MPIGDSTAWIDEPPRSASLSGGDVLRWLLRRQRASIAVGMLAGIVWMGAIAAVPFVLGRAIDEGIAASDATVLALWLAALAALGVLEAGAGAVRHRHAAALYERSAVAGSELVAERALRPTGGLERAVGVGEAISHATSDAEALGGPVDLMCRGSAAIVAFVAVAAVVFSIAPVLGALLVAGMPLALLAMVPLWRPLDRRAGAQQRTLAEASGLAADAVAGLDTIKGLGAERAARDAYRAGTRGVRGAALAVARLHAAWEALRVVVPGIFLAAVAWLGGRLALEREITPGELVACFGYAAFLVTPVRTFGEIGEVWAQGIASARRIAALVSVPAAVADAVGDRRGAVPPRPGAVAFDGVSLEGVLDGLDLDVAAGARVGIACAHPGAAGALIDLLARNVDPDAGRVTLDGVDLRELALSDLRAAVVCAEHDAFLFAGTLRDNLLPARQDAGDEQLLAALRFVAADDVTATGDGLELVVAERGRSLSGGQRQRVALARALLAGAPVLVLDAPTHAVDAVTEQRIVERLASERVRRTTIVLDPSPALARVLDEIMLVDGGRIVARAPHVALLGRSAVYAALVEGVA